MCDLVNHTHFPKEDHLPYWARRDNQVKKGDRVQFVGVILFWMCIPKLRIKVMTQRQLMWGIRAGTWSVP